jgi:hypothetical protein
MEGTLEHLFNGQQAIKYLVMKKEYECALELCQEFTSLFEEFLILLSYQAETQDDQIYLQRICKAYGSSSLPLACILMESILTQQKQPDATLEDLCARQCPEQSAQLYLEWGLPERAIWIIRRVVNLNRKLQKVWISPQKLKQILTAALHRRDQELSYAVDRLQAKLEIANRMQHDQGSDCEPEHTVAS